MHNFGKEKEKELTTMRTFTKNTWHDWCDLLINYIPEPMKNRGLC